MRYAWFRDASSQEPSPPATVAHDVGREVGFVNDPAATTQAAVTDATPQFRSQVGHISRQSGIYFAGILFTTGFGYIFKIYLARVLGAQDLGLYALGVTLMGFFGIFNSLGLP